MNRSVGSQRPPSMRCSRPPSQRERQPNRLSGDATFQKGQRLLNQSGGSNVVRAFNVVSGGSELCEEREALGDIMTVKVALRNVRP